jgi:hypothetical protein
MGTWWKREKAGLINSWKVAEQKEAKIKWTPTIDIKLTDRQHLG